MDRALKGQPVIVVRSGRNPHSVSLAIGLVLVSLYGIFFSTPSVSIDSGLEVYQRVMFGACSVVGAVMVLFGIFWRDLRHGLETERAGQLLLATGATTYVIVLCQVSTFARSGLVTVVAAAIGIGCLWRIYDITRDLRVLRKAGR